MTAPAPTAEDLERAREIVDKFDRYYPGVLEFSDQRRRLEDDIIAALAPAREEAFKAGYENCFSRHSLTGDARFEAGRLAGIEAAEEEAVTAPAPTAADLERAREIVAQGLDHYTPECHCGPDDAGCPVYAHVDAEVRLTKLFVAALAQAREEAHDHLHIDCLNERYAAGRLAGIEAAAKETGSFCDCVERIRALAEKGEK